MKRLIIGICTFYAIGCGEVGSLSDASSHDDMALPPDVALPDSGSPSDAGASDLGDALRQDVSVPDADTTPPRSEYHTADEIRSLASPAQERVLLLGPEGGDFLWDDTSVGEENGLGTPKSAGTTIRPNGHEGPGRWIRVIMGMTNARWFGPIDEFAINRAAVFAGTLDLPLSIPNGTYLIEGPIVVETDLLCENVRLMFLGDFGGDGALLTQSRTRSVRGITVDGQAATNVQYGLFFNADTPQTSTAFIRATIENISNDNSSYGAFASIFSQSRGAPTNASPDLDISIDVSNVRATANGTVGDRGGAARGIYVTLLGTGIRPTVRVHDCRLDNITPVEDGDAIHISSRATGSIHIDTVHVRRSAKRAFKIQAPNVRLTNCTAENGGGYDTYSPNTVFENCRYDGSRPAFVIHSNGSELRNCEAQTSSANLLMVAAGVSGTTVEGFRGTTTFDFSDALNAGAFQVRGDMHMSDVVLVGGATGGSGVIAIGSCNLIASDVQVRGFRNGVFMSYSTGQLTFDALTTEQVDFGINRIGGSSDDQMLVTAQNSTLFGRVFAALVSNSADHARAIFRDSAFEGENGILVREGSTIENCSVSPTAGMGGRGISLRNNSRVLNSRVESMAVGFSYAYTTTAEVVGNTAVGCTVAFETTGYTPHIEHDNVAL